MEDRRAVPSLVEGTPLRAIGCVLGIAATLALVPAPAATAGTYPVYACVQGQGHYFRNQSWAPVGSGAVTVDGECIDQSDGMSVGAQAGPDIPSGQGRGLVFTAPEDTEIADFAIARRLYYFNPPNPGGGQDPLHVLMSMGGTVFEGEGNYELLTRNRLWDLGRWWYGYDRSAQYAGAYDTAGSYSTAPQGVYRSLFAPVLGGLRGVRTLSLSLGCFYGTCSVDPGGAGRPAGSVSGFIGAAVVFVNDPIGPRLSVQATGLLAPGDRAGNEAVTFSASDSSGIIRADLLDGSSVIRSRIFTDPDQTSQPCDFGQAKPCADSSSQTLAPPGALSAGQHTIRVRVYDAGGNVDEVTTPISVRSGARPRARGAPNGAVASDSARLVAYVGRRRQLQATVRYRSRTVIRGRLIGEGGAPISGAVVDAASNANDPSADVQGGETTTGKDGRFRYRIPPGPSREVSFEYRSHFGDERPVTSASVDLNVRAGVAISRRGGRLRGKLLGGPFPEAGVRVKLQRRRGRRWKTFKKLRSDEGTFLARIGPGGPIRALVPRQRGYPYASGTSRSIER